VVVVVEEEDPQPRQRPHYEGLENALAHDWSGWERANNKEKQQQQRHRW